MAHLVTLSQLETFTRRLADLENATFRFPQAEVWDYINRGIIYVYRQLIVVQDRPYFQKDYSFNTVSTQSVYPLPADFLQIMSLRWANNPSGPWTKLRPYEESEYHTLLNAGYVGAVYPRYYGIVGGSGAFTQGTIPTAYGLEILPKPVGGGTISLRYLPVPQPLQNATDTIDGLLGFEDAACTWAAILMRRKDDLPTAELESDMARYLGEIRVIAKHRDRSGPPKIQQTRTWGMHGRYGGRGRWGY